MSWIASEVWLNSVSGADSRGVGGMTMDAWPRHGLQGLLSGAAFLLVTGLAVGAIRRTTEP